MYFEDTCATDGVNATSLGMFQNRPAGDIYDHAKWGGSHLFDLKPLRWSLCPYDSQLGIDLAEWTRRGEMEQIGELSCTVFEAKLSEFERRVLWVGPKSHLCVVLKYAVEDTERTIAEWKCEYRLDDDSQRPIPTSWVTMRYYSDGTVKTHSDAIVSRCDLDVPVKDSDFRITFPVGAVVSDGRQLDSRGREQ